jgi:hypothetical protein
MKNYLIPSLVAVILFAACTRDQIDPAPEPRLIPYAIYELKTATFDTSAPISVFEFWYDTQQRLTGYKRRLIEPNNVNHYFTYQYESNGNLSFEVLNGIDWSKVNYTYVNGQPKYATSNYRRSEFFFNPTGQLTARIDSNVTSSEFFRADSLLYSYTDSLIKVRRIITLRSTLFDPVTGEAQYNLIFLNKAYNNPFDQLGKEVSTLPTSTIGFSDQILYAKQGMASEFQMLKLDGRIDYSRKFEVLATRANTRYPTLFRISQRTFSSFGGIDTTRVSYQHILYREL